MKWYKVNEWLPQTGEYVLVATLNYFDQYANEFCHVMRYTGDGRWEYSDSWAEYEIIHNTDRWAYIELPED